MNTPKPPSIFVSALRSTSIVSWERFQVSFLGSSIFLFNLVTGEAVQDHGIIFAVSKYLKAEGFIN